MILIQTARTDWPLGNFPLYTPPFLKEPLKTFLERNTYSRCTLSSPLSLRNLILTLILSLWVMPHFLALAFLLVVTRLLFAE